MNKEELNELSRNIPLALLREKYPNIHSRSKTPFIEALRRDNLKELEYLAVYHSLKKKAPFFLVHVKKDVLSKIKEFKGKEFKLDEIDNLFKIKDVIEKNKQEYIVQIQAHTKVYRQSNLERPDTLEKFSVEYRKPYSIYAICHIKDSAIEVCTRSQNKVQMIITLFAYVLGIDKDNFKKETFEGIEFDKLKEKIYYKGMVFKGLNFAGLEEVGLKGPNVKRGVEYFKEQGIDLEKEAKDKQFIKSEMGKQPISFYQTGKISVSKRIRNAYEFVMKKVFSRDDK